MVQKMRKMKDSGIEWIGEIPEGWKIIPVKYLAKYNYDTLAESCSPDFEFSYIDIGSVTYTDGITNYQNFKFKDAPSRARRIVHSGDILVSTVRTYLRAVACVNEHRLPQIASTGFLVLQADISKIHPHFLMYSVLSDNFICKVEANSVGISYPAINASQIVHFKLPIPQLSEQFLLVTYLDQQCSKIDALLSKTRSSIEEYKKLKQSVITQAVTKGVRGEREMKNSGVDYIGQIPAEWVLGKLRNVGDTQNGISKSSEFFGKGFPFVSYSDVYKNYSLPSTVSGLVDSTSEEQKRYSVKKGDIFFTRTSETIEEVGFSCVCEKDIPNATFAGFLIRVRPFSDKLYTPYAKYYFRSSHLRFYLVKEMNLVTRASLGQSLLKSMPVLLPPLEEQKEIADYLDTKCAEIDGLIAKKDQLVKELESYKKSLIYEVVTGKREV